MKKQVWMFVLVILFIGSSSTSAQDRVVVVPLFGEEMSVSGTATIFIPVGSLLLGNNATINSNTRVYLVSSGISSFSSSLVVPNDHKPNTNIYVDLMVYNPPANGACQADIRTNFGRRFRAGLPVDLTNIFGWATAFPPYGAGDRTISHQYRFKTGVGAGDAFTFGWFRAGDDPDDNCGSVEVVGINVRYERE